jgi:hypothetical protein
MNSITLNLLKILLSRTTVATGNPLIADRLSRIHPTDQAEF